MTSDEPPNLPAVIQGTVVERLVRRVFLDMATTAPRSERLTQDMVTRALGALGIAAINAALKDGQGIDYRRCRTATALAGASILICPTR